MKKISIITLLAVGALVLQANEEATKEAESNQTVQAKPAIVEPAEQKAEGIKYIKMLGGSLKEALQKEMKADPSGMKALEFCSKKADEITKEVNSKLPDGASVRRTALRTRAKDNAPDPADLGAMEEFKKAAENKKLTPKNIVAIDLGDSVRVYKPLLVQKVCLKCHGSEVSDELKAKIKERYPDDKALGFSEGDFRGVIVSEIKK